MVTACVVLMACVVLLVLPDSHAQGVDGDQRCSVGVRAYGVPAPTYGGDERRNPDGTYYPGDALHYLFVYRGLETCRNFSIGEVKSFGTLNVNEHRIARAIGTGGMDGGVPVLQPRTHSHGAYEIGVEWSEHDGVVWGHGGAPHGRHGGIEYEDDSSVQGLLERAGRACESDRKYAGCAWGHVEVGMDAVNETCLHDEMGMRGVALPGGVPDQCRKANYITMGVEGEGVRCKDTPDGRVCTTYTAADTATVRVEVLEPSLGLKLSKPPLLDAYGFEAQNLDGTYYLHDPVHVVHQPVFKWKEERGGTVWFKAYRHWNPEEARHRLLPIGGMLDCGSDRCDGAFLLPGLTSPVWHLTNGDGQTAYNATDSSWLGMHDLRYRVEVFNICCDEGRMMNHTEGRTAARAVVFDPVFHSTTYPVLADDGKYGYQNRFALASYYGGSWGGGPDDANMTEPYQYRRARMDAAYGAVGGYDPANLTALAWNIVWSEAPPTPAHVLEYGAPGHPGASFHSASAPQHPGGPLSPDGAAMWPKAGHGRIFFDFPDLAEHRPGQAGSRYTNATAHVYAGVRDFAAVPLQVLASGAYTYPEASFHQAISVRSVDSEGDLKPLRMSLVSEPRIDAGAVTLADYIKEKVLYDTGDAGFADLAIHDAYPMGLEIHTDTGAIDAKIRRTASLFPKFSHAAHVGPETPGGPGRLVPYWLGLPDVGDLAGMLSGLSGLAAPAGNEAGSFQPGGIVPNPAGIEGWDVLDLLAQFAPPGRKAAPEGAAPEEDMLGGIAGGIVPEGLRMNGTAPETRPDIEALMGFQGVSEEFGYGGLAEQAAETYMAFPDTARMNFPLSHGLAVLTPLNVTLFTDTYAQGMNHRFSDLEGSVEVVINTDTDNVLLAERDGGTLMITRDENFGTMIRLRVDGSGLGGPRVADGSCLAGCTLHVGWGSLDVAAYNKWGGEAHYTSGELDAPGRAALPEPARLEWAAVLVLVPLGILAQRIIGNRLSYGVWSVAK